MVTKDEWNRMSIAEQGEAWEQMDDAERRIVRPDWKPIRLESVSTPVPKKRLAGTEICADCGTVGESRKITPGSFAIEVLLWLFFLLPGVIYSVWRLTAAQYACPECGGKMIGLNTPRGEKLYTEITGDPLPPLPSEAAVEDTGEPSPKVVGIIFAMIALIMVLAFILT